MEVEHEQPPEHEAGSVDASNRPSTSSENPNPEEPCPQPPSDPIIDDNDDHCQFLKFLIDKIHIFPVMCRVCRGNEGSLYYPCLCTGSIKYVHQECLVEWLKYR